MILLPVKILMKALRIKVLILLLALSVLSGLTIYIPTREDISFAQRTSNTLTQDELDDLKKQLDETQKKLTEIKDQKDQIGKQINNESSQQRTLAEQAKYLDSLMRQNNLQVQSLELEIDKLDLELKILKEEKNKLEIRLAEIQARREDLYKELSSSMNLLYKMSLSAPTFLEKDTSFESAVIGQEKQKAMTSLVRSTIAEVQKIEEEVQTKKDEIVKKEKEVSDLQTQRKAQSDNLVLQKQALAWQKQNKQSLIEQSIKKQEDLADQKEDIDKQILEYEAKIATIRSSLAQLPPSGAYVAAGQVIGFQGRSGLNCAPYDSSLVPVKTNNYCEKYGGTGPGWYYYDPVSFPTKGSHLHFEYYKGGREVNPYTYLFDPSSTEFKYKPMQPMRISRGCHQGCAYDLTSSYGAPIYAVKAGKVSYYCINYPNVPGFTDPAYGAVVYHMDDNGKFDGTVSQYWHMQRRGAPCNYRY